MTNRAPIRAPFKHWCRQACQLHLPKVVLGGTIVIVFVLWSVFIDVPVFLSTPATETTRSSHPTSNSPVTPGALLSVSETNRVPGEGGTPL